MQGQLHEPRSREQRTSAAFHDSASPESEKLSEPTTTLHARDVDKNVICSVGFRPWFCCRVSITLSRADRTAVGQKLWLSRCATSVLRCRRRRALGVCLGRVGARPRPCIDPSEHRGEESRGEQRRGGEGRGGEREGRGLCVTRRAWTLSCCRFWFAWPLPPSRSPGHNASSAGALDATHQVRGLSRSPSLGSAGAEGSHKAQRASSAKTAFLLLKAGGWAAFVVHEERGRLPAKVHGVWLETKS